MALVQADGAPAGRAADRPAARAADGGEAHAVADSNGQAHHQVEIPECRPAPAFLRLSAGFVYFYFGFVKFYTDLSPAELLASQTIMRVWPWSIDAHTVLLWLSVVEVVIGLAFLFNAGLRWIFPIFILHQLGTFMPLFLYPELTFKFAPFAPTIEGQYILKNLISLAAGITVMWPAVRSVSAHKRALREAARLQAESAATVRVESAPRAVSGVRR